MDTLIPLSLQAKDNPILQQLLPSLLSPAVLGRSAALSVSALTQCGPPANRLRSVSAGDLSTITGLHNMLGMGAGSILLPPVQTSALGVPLLQGPDGAINLLNNIQVGEQLDQRQSVQVTTDSDLQNDSRSRYSAVCLPVYGC